MALPNLQRSLGVIGILVLFSACSDDQHRLGDGNNPIGKAGNSGTGGGSSGSGGSGGVSAGGTAGNPGTGGTPATGGSAGTDPCAGVPLPPCAPKCSGGFEIAGTKCTPGDACTITNVGDQCACSEAGTWMCEVHPPLGTGCNLVCEYSTPNLQWYTTCGDPVCQSPDPDDPNIPNCTTEQEGQPCAKQDAFCEIPGDSCGANLLCTDSDPTAGGCPISRARYKDDIAYLGERELASVSDEFLHMRMARWRYKTEPLGSKPHLGFIIDDQPDSPAVMANGERVDLYGYTSMAASTIQVQQKQIESLQRELKALRKTVDERCRK